MYSGNSVQGYCSQRFCFISDLKIKMEKFLAIGSVISLCVFFSMFVFHLLLLIKVLQCSYDERIVQLLLPPSSYNLSDNATAADREMISNMTRCRYGTFLEEDKFVMVDFTSDCIIITSSDGMIHTQPGSECGGQPRVIFSDNKTVFLDLTTSDEGIFFAKDGLYICS